MSLEERLFYFFYFFRTHSPSLGSLFLPYRATADSEFFKVRNIVSSALSLARIDKKSEKLTERHLKDVLGITKEFQKQLDSITTETRGINEAGRSRKGR